MRRALARIADVGVRLAREHRVPRLAIDLRALDLAVPVRALDQAHGNAAAGAAREIGEPVDHERRALLVRLHGEAIAFPTVERCIRIRSADDVERELEAIGFLGIDGEADAVGLGECASSSTRGTSSSITRARLASS
jgi:hypothetical protein